MSTRCSLHSQTRPILPGLQRRTQAVQHSTQHHKKDAWLTHGILRKAEIYALQQHDVHRSIALDRSQDRPIVRTHPQRKVLPTTRNEFHAPPPSFHRSLERSHGERPPIRQSERPMERLRYSIRTRSARRRIDCHFLRRFHQVGASDAPPPVTNFRSVL
jgi:hypothetical protein